MDASYASIDADFEQFVNVAGPRSKLEARLRLTNEWKILPYTSVWGIHSNDYESITNVPGTDSIAGVKLKQIIHRGNILYDVAYRKALDSFMPASILVNYQLSPRWAGNIKVGYNQEAFENSFIRLGGVDDQVDIGVNYTYDNYNALFFEATALDYYSQNRYYLGSGVNLSGLYQYKLRLSYPDYTIGIFSDMHSFSRSGSFAGDVTTLFPSLSPEDQLNPQLVSSNNNANYKDLIPNRYYDTGLMFSFGNSIVDYTHSWRPYLSARLYYNTATMLSYDLRGGLNGTVFGRDSLLIYSEYGTAQTTPNQKNYTVGLRYLIYF